MARSFYIRLRRGDHLLDHEVEFPDLESARRGAAKGAKALLSECIKRGRDPTEEAVIILDSDRSEMESVALLQTLPDLLRDRIEIREGTDARDKSEPRAGLWSWLRQ
jgi:hypothetical protein